MKVALVTGAGKGIGKAIALELAKDHLVIVHYRHSPRSTVKEIERAGGRAIALRADISKPVEVERLFENVKKKFGRLDVLVNNVGNFQHKPIRCVSASEWTDIIQTNLNGTFYCCVAALPLLRKSRGQIINLGTATADKIGAKPNNTAYCVSKTGVLILTETLAVTEAPVVRVNMVSPGIMENSVIKPKAPLGVGKVEEIAKAVRFILESPYMTGANVKVAGGFGLT